MIVQLLAGALTGAVTFMVMFGLWSVLAVLQKRRHMMRCVWCGDVVSLDTERDHWRKCPLHPARLEVATLTDRVAELEAASDVTAHLLAKINSPHFARLEERNVELSDRVEELEAQLKDARTMSNRALGALGKIAKYTETSFDPSDPEATSSNAAMALLTVEFARRAEADKRVPGVACYEAGAHRFDTPVYVRPCGRGVVIDEASGLQIEDAVKEGRYHLRALFTPLDAQP